jgi:hypothetical protein
LEAVRNEVWMGITREAGRKGGNEEDHVRRVVVV